MCAQVCVVGLEGLGMGVGVGKMGVWMGRQTHSSMAARHGACLTCLQQARSLRRNLSWLRQTPSHGSCGLGPRGNQPVQRNQLRALGLDGHSTPASPEHQLASKAHLRNGAEAGGRRMLIYPV